jgi:hypothetical protein
LWQYRATLSLGGNDLGFGGIAIYCLYVVEPLNVCGKRLAEAWRLLEGDDSEFERAMRSAYLQILETATTPQFTLIVTGYARFFNEEADHCITKSLNPLIRYPKLTRDIRSQLNNLVLKVNNVLKKLVEEINKDNETRHPRKYIRFYDIDGNFNGHRICDHDTEDWNDEHWFFTPIRNLDPRPDEPNVPPQNPGSNYDHELKRRSKGGNYFWEDLYPVDYSICPPEDTWGELDNELGDECALMRAMDPGRASYPTNLEPRSWDAAKRWKSRMMHPKWTGHGVSDA